MSIKEAGTQKRASWEVFSFNPAPSSPVHNYNRNSTERPRSLTTRNSWRASAFGNDPKTPSSLRNSMDTSRPVSVMADSGTQTDDLPDPPSGTRHSRSTSRASITSTSQPSRMPEVPENSVLDTSPERNEPESASRANGYTTPPHTPPMTEQRQDKHEDELDADDDIHIEEPVVHTVQTMQPASPQVISKASARIVNVPKRVPPKLPPRNPNRSGGSGGPLVIDASPKDAPGSSEDLPAAVSPVETKHDPVQEAGAAESEKPEHERTPVSPLAETMQRVRLDSEGDDEDEMAKRNPWAKVEEKRARESIDAEDEGSGIGSGSAAMPGGFN